MPRTRTANAVSESAESASDRPEYRVESLAKGLRILSLFDERRPSWRVTDLAAAAGLPMPTVYRVVMTLTSEGYLDHLPNGDYRPGVRVLTLGTAALRSLDLVGVATPKLQDLALFTGETVNLAVLTGDQVLYLVRLRNSDLVTANIQVGSTLPAVHTSIGKLLLAQLDEDDLLDRITSESLGAPPPPPTGVGAAGRGARLRAAVGGRTDHRAGRHRHRRCQPRRPGSGLVRAEARPRTAAVGAQDQRRDLSTALPRRGGVTRRPETRLAKLDPESLSETQRALYESIARGRRAQGPQLFRLTDEAGRLEGPFNAFLLQPAVGTALQALGAAVRYETALTDRARELAILVVAASSGSDFEWYAHEAVARSVGVSDEELLGVRAGRHDVLTDELEHTSAWSAWSAPRGSSSF